MKLELTSLAKEELVRLHKIQYELIESDIDLYFDFSSYDQLLFDLELFVEEAYKQYQTQAAFSAAVLLAGLALVTLVLKEILERKTRIKDVEN